MSKTETERSRPGAQPQKPRSAGAAEQPLPGREELAAFVRSLEGNAKSPHTVKQYRHMVEQLLWFARKPPSQITRDDIESFKHHLTFEKRYQKNSLYAAVRAVQAFYRHLGSDIAGKVSAPKRREMVPNFLSEDEVSRMFDASRAVSRDYAILATLAYTGVRVSELCNMDVDDVDFSAGTVKVRSGKGDKDRMLVLDEQNAVPLRDYLAGRVRPVLEPATTVGGLRRHPLFLSERGNRVEPRGVERLVKRCAHDAGIQKKVTPHTLRHTLATTLLKKGMDIRFIQQILGHSSVATTQIYTHVDTEMIRQQYAKAHVDFTKAGHDIPSSVEAATKAQTAKV